MELQDSLFSDIELLAIEASPAQKFLSIIIDSFLEIGSLVLFYLILPTEIQAFLSRNKPVSSYVVVFTWFIMYRMITILFFQRTIGMAVCRTKFLNDNLLSLTGKEKMIAIIGIRVKKIKLYKVL